MVPDAAESFQMQLPARYGMWMLTVFRLHSTARYSTVRDSGGDLQSFDFILSVAIMQGVLLNMELP